MGDSIAVKARLVETAGQAPLTRVAEAARALLASGRVDLTDGTLGAELLEAVLAWQDTRVIVNFAGPQVCIDCRGPHRRSNNRCRRTLARRRAEGIVMS